MHRPLLVDLTIEDQSRLKVIYGSAEGFHAVDLDSATVYDIYLPKHVSQVNELHFFAATATTTAYCNRLILKWPFLMIKMFWNFVLDSGSNNTTLHCGTAEFERYAIASVLRQ